MDSDQVSFAIRPGNPPGEPEALYEEAWELLAGTIRKNAKHACAAQVLKDYLPETRSDGAGNASEKEIAFVFLSPSSACDVQMAVAAHWFELAIALAQKELAALTARHGFSFKPGKKTAKELARAKRKVPFVGDGKRIVGVLARKKPRVMIDGEGDLALDEAELSKPGHKAVLAAAKSGQCACPFCAAIRKGTTTVPKPKPAKKPVPEPAAPPGAPPKLQHYTSIAKAIKNAERCGSVEERPMRSIEVPREIAQLRHVKELRLGHLAQLPDELFGLTTLESLSFTYGIVSAPPEEHDCPAAIGQLVNLRSLALPCTFTTLPATLGDLALLERLDLSSTHAYAIPPAIGRLSRLRWLSITSASYLKKKLPDLGQLTELEFLDLTHVKKPAGVLDAIDFSGLVKLKELRLQNTRLATYPATLRGLPALERLNIQRTDFAELPPDFAGFKALVVLDAWGSGLVRWPESLNDLPALTTIDLRKSDKLADASALRSLPALESLDLSDTPLTSLPERAPRLPALQRLSLRRTKLAQLPAWIAALPALEWLDLSGVGLAPGEIDALRKKRPTLQVVS